MSPQQSENFASLVKESERTAPVQASLKSNEIGNFPPTTNCTISTALGRWLEEGPHQEHWNGMARLDSKTQGTT
jgi:hypothetical protein